MSRRLPVYVLVDTSGSMHGESIQAVNSGAQMLLSTLRQDPQALETVYLSFITFNSEVKQVAPLEELPSVSIPELKASGATNMGAALKLVKECADREVTKTSAEVKGDWKPMVFILTDGAPTDELRGLDDFKSGNWGVVVVCSSGDTSEMTRITDNVFRTDTLDESTLKSFFKWVTASVTAGSRSVGNGKDLGSVGQLPPPPPELQVVI